jgi:hypothetical protein
MFVTAWSHVVQLPCHSVFFFPYTLYMLWAFIDYSRSQGYQYSEY